MFEGLEKHSGQTIYKARQTEFTVYRHNFFFCMRAGGHYSDFILATVCDTGNNKPQITGNRKTQITQTTKPQTLQACKLLTGQDIDRPAMAARDIK